MKFGIFYEHSVQRPWTDISEWRAYHQALEQICLADELGFDQVWEVEHHFLEEYSHSSAPEVFLSAAAAMTKKIHVCQGIALCLPGVNHPARIAERAAALDIIASGRFEFGTGRAATWTELGGFQVEPDDTKDMWDEVIRAIPHMWTNEIAGWQGKYFSMPERAVLPKPVQKPHPPMWVAVSSPETAIQAAERGMGLLGVSIGTPDQYAQRIADYRRVIQNADPVGKFVNNCVNGVGWMYCGESDEEAKALGGAGAAAFMNAAAHLVGVGNIYPSPAYSSQASAIQLRDRPGDVINPLQQGTPIGSPETVISRAAPVGRGRRRPHGLPDQLRPGRAAREDPRIAAALRRRGDAGLRRARAPVADDAAQLRRRRGDRPAGRSGRRRLTPHRSPIGQRGSHSVAASPRRTSPSVCLANAEWAATRAVVCRVRRQNLRRVKLATDCDHTSVTNGEAIDMPYEQLLATDATAASEPARLRPPLRASGRAGVGAAGLALIRLWRR